MYDHYIEDPADHKREHLMMLISRFNHEIGKSYKRCLETFQGVDSRVASGIAAFLALPRETADRKTTINHLLRGGSRDFTGEALIALSDYLDTSRSVRRCLGQDWRQWMKYPQHVEDKIGKKMDDMACVIGPSDALDEYGRMSDFLNEAQKINMIDERERMRLRQILGPEM